MRQVLVPGLLVAVLLLHAPAAWARYEATSGTPAVAERLNRARDAIQANDFSNALAELQEAVQDEPANADVHNLLAYAFRKQTQPDLPKAFAHYRQALRLDPGHRGAHEYIGEAYLMDHKPNQARVHLATLEKLCGNRTCVEYLELARAIEVHERTRK